MRTVDGRRRPRYHHAVQGLALIDFDNFRPKDAKSRADIEFHAEELIDRTARAFVRVFPASRELDIRLYGGWTDPRGRLSRDAEWLTEILPEMRGRRHRLIVRPSLATTMLQFPEMLLLGTVRGTNRRLRQKMIDGMIGCDAMYMSDDGQTYVSVVSDDDDLLPAAISAHAMKPEGMVWMRSRRAGDAINDSSLLSHGLPLVDLGSM